MDKNKDKISAMFNEIAYRYDFLNHFLSLGIDKIWRKRVVRLVKECNPKNVLDIAAGTGDLSIALAKEIELEKIIGVDISEKMLEIAEQKSKKLSLDNKILFEIGDALSLEYEDNSFDAVTVAFGVRNFENLEDGLKEMLRVTKEGGKVVILELSMPKNVFVQKLYNIYFTKVLPIVGRLTSKSDFAYTYLPLSVENFIDGETFISLMNKIGYKQSSIKRVCFGIATIYYGVK